MEKFFFGKEKAEKYGSIIIDGLSGKTISKYAPLVNEPGGVVYEANRLGITEWDLLEALEGLCHMGVATEIDDSTYFIRAKGKKNELFTY